MAYDFKKEYKEFYMPPKRPTIVDVPPMNYIAVRGWGDPNAEGGEYKASIGLLYGVAFTVKMSKLEGFWRQQGSADGIDYTRKGDLEFISCIRLPDFVTREEFQWAVSEAERKKKEDFSRVEFLTVREGLCVQCMHLGPYDSEPETVRTMHEFMRAHDCDLDISDIRPHHEIYLSDPRKCAPERLKTVVRHPVRRTEVCGTANGE